MGYDFAVFDFDGTLADSREWFAASLDQAAERFGFRRVGRAEMEELRSCGTREIIRRLEVPAWKLPFVARHMRRQAAIDADQIRLFPGAGDALAALKHKGIGLAIVSSNGEEHVCNILGQDLAAIVAAYGCGASLFGKAAKLRKVLRRCGVSPERAIYIGDETRDVEAARMAGAASGAVSWGYAAVAALQRMDPTVTFSVSDLACLCSHCRREMPR